MCVCNYVSLYVGLSVCDLCLSVCSFSFLCLGLSDCLSVGQFLPSSMSRSVSLSVCRFVCLPSPMFRCVSPSVCRSAYLSVSLPNCLFVCLFHPSSLTRSFYLSACQIIPSSWSRSVCLIFCLPVCLFHPSSMSSPVCIFLLGSSLTVCCCLHSWLYLHF